MTRWIRVGAGSAGALATAVLAGACGSSHSAVRSAPAAAYRQQSAPAIIAEVVSALKTVTGYRATGSVKVDGAYDGVAYSVKLPSDLDFSLREGSQLERLISLPGAGYLYANTAFWRAHGHLSAAQAASVANRWFKTSSSDAAGLTKSLGDIGPAQLGTCLSREVRTFSVTGHTTVAGQAVVVLHDSGAQPGTYPANLYVATRAPHYPVRLQATGNARPGGSGPCAKGSGDRDSAHNVLTFSDWNAVTVSAPPDAKPLP